MPINKTAHIIGLMGCVENAVKYSLKYSGVPWMLPASEEKIYCSVHPLTTL